MLRGCRYANPRPNSNSCSSSTFCTPSRPMSKSPESPSKYQRGVTYLSSKPSVSVSIPDGHHHSTTAASSGFLVSSCVFVKTSSHTNHLQPQNMQAEAQRLGVRGPHGLHCLLKLSYTVRLTQKKIVKVQLAFFFIAVSGLSGLGLFLSFFHTESTYVVLASPVLSRKPRLT